MKYIPVLVIISMFWIGCENSSKKNSSKAEQTHSEEHEGHSEAIALNNGKKWKVDEHMLVCIRRMESEAKISDKDGKQNHKALSDSLTKNIELLTSNCTMKGQAHDELHKWLLPFIEQVESFSKTAEKTDSNQAVKEFQASFEVFNKYFE